MSSDKGTPNKITNGFNRMAIEDPDKTGDEDFEALDAELDHLNSALDQMENWSTSLHDKVAEFLKETQEQNRHVASSTTAQGTEADSDCENNSNSKSVESEATNSTDNDKCSVDGTSSSVPKKEEKSAEN